MLIREYQPSDCKELTELFYNTVHKINAKDYTKEQLDVWATGQADLKKWNRLLQEHFSIVGVEDGIIVGFGDLDKTGYLDRLYVHSDYQRKGIATAICNRLESAVQENVVTHASITARPFFEKRGYKVVKEQQVERQGIFLTNYVMIKEQKMAEFKYQFKAVNDQKKISGSKILNIIDGFPSDYSEQKVLIYGKLKTLFGDPLYEEKDVENQYTYGVVTTTEDGREVFLHAYNGPSGPAIGGQKDEESRKAAYQLLEMIQQTPPTDYDYVGYYWDAPSRIKEGIKNGVPYYEEVDLEDLSEEETDEISRELKGQEQK